jgi:hypothetical protein
MTVEAGPARGGTDSPLAYVGLLEGLAEVVIAQGLKARLVTPPGVDVLG